MQDIPQWKLIDHFDGVSVKIVVHFVGGNQDSIEQLLDLGVTGLRLIEYLADEVYRLLDLVHMPDHLALDDDGSTDYSISGCNVK
jgi:hypothetical protein